MHLCVSVCGVFLCVCVCVGGGGLQTSRILYTNDQVICVNQHAR